MQSLIYKKIQEAALKKMGQLAVLIDPDKSGLQSVLSLVRKCNEAHVDLLLIGGSYDLERQHRSALQEIALISNIPVVLFPAGLSQVDGPADGILLLSLISGRNPEYLIGKHVEAAPVLAASGMEIMPTGYILVDGGKNSAVAYVSNTSPVPADQANIAVATALAGQMLGMKLIYLEAGSGALSPVPADMIRKVSLGIDIPLIVGGGIRDAASAEAAIRAGADMIVVGNVLEDNPDLVFDLSAAVHRVKITSV